MGFRDSEYGAWGLGSRVFGFSVLAFSFFFFFFWGGGGGGEPKGELCCLVLHMNNYGLWLSCLVHLTFPHPTQAGIREKDIEGLQVYHPKLKVPQAKNRT